MIFVMMTSIVHLSSNGSQVRTNQNARITWVNIYCLIIPFHFLWSASVLRDSRLMMAFSSSSLASRIRASSSCFLLSSYTFICSQFSFVSLVSQTQESFEPFLPSICRLALSNCKCCLSGVTIGGPVM